MTIKTITQSTALIISSLLSLSASAVPVTHLGGVFDVTGSIVDSDTADFTYTADFTNWTGASDYIFAIDFKVSGLNISSVDSFSTNATGGWVTSYGPTNANGCADNGNTTFLCAEDNVFETGNAQATDGIVEWLFTVTFDSDISLAHLANEENHIGAFFTDCSKEQSCGKGKEGLSLPTSFTTTNVSEPGSLALLGIGLIGLGAVRRKLKS